MENSKPPKAGEEKDEVVLISNNKPPYVVLDTLHLPCLSLQINTDVDIERCGNSKELDKVPLPIPCMCYPKEGLSKERL